MLLNVAFSELKMKKGKVVLTNGGSIKFIGKQLESIRGVVDVLIVDSSSIDNTASVALAHGAAVRIVAQNDFNHASTRNIALEYPDYDFYCFMTQDALPIGDDFFQKLTACFDDNDVVVAYARQIPRGDADPIERFARGRNYPPISHTASKGDIKKMGIRAFFCSNSCAIYRADYFRYVCGFTSGLIRNEDMEFAARAVLGGKKKVYNADALVVHSHSTDIFELAHRYYEIGLFFKQNKWILDALKVNGAKLESTGISQVVLECRYILASNPAHIAKSLSCIFVKFFGYKIGFMLGK